MLLFPVVEKTPDIVIKTGCNFYQTATTEVECHTKEKVEALEIEILKPEH